MCWELVLKHIAGFTGETSSLGHILLHQACHLHIRLTITEYGPALHIRRLEQTLPGTECYRAALSASAAATTGFPSKATPTPNRVMHGSEKVRNRQASRLRQEEQRVSSMATQLKCHVRGQFNLFQWSWALQSTRESSIFYLFLCKAFWCLLNAMLSMAFNHKPLIFISTETQSRI